MERDYDLISFFNSYRILTQQMDSKTYNSIIIKMKKMGLDSSDSKWRRLAATKTLYDLREEFKLEESNGAKAKVDTLTEIINEIKKKTKDSWLLDVYNYYNY